ncbi:UDP-N-acetylmuramoyl-L-alanine--D-glutamate ligase [Altericroceibacterium spongiae]|uniref:UDP-N-acetylmuramoylalanine--D-glutamate ligase n=1 Tax=Altericroceibacterium spongiae TaxID=2320269 RepID=A0A420EKT1_9SPHN|nr:UDP-N-acetylmuramoyl-L-alanine--D-glutamate ligase [Altericroceibacterium spongiae]RKF21206.1 UDP-N-acetylmuramoyl-L-alanine--D-glutamate ligase [Altericroceibacterium spongiae]
MITSRAFSGKHYAVLGLARSGLAVVDALLASGAQVTAWDRQDNARDQVAGRATLADPLDIDLRMVDAVIVSPGVPLNRHPIAQKARDAGVPLIGDIELFAQARADLPSHRVVGITGTNGKSTTTALLHHLFDHAGVPVRMGGNIGLPVMGEKPLEPNAQGAGVYVLELSSYQIDLTRTLACDGAALTNITPDHLDRYDGFAGYAASKARLFAMQRAGQFAVFGCADPETCAVQQAEAARRPEGRAVCAAAGPWADMQCQWPSLQGPHNLQNAVIAIAMAREMGLSDGQIANGLASFRGLPHRMERIAEHDGILYINDSKATNPASTAPALAAFPPDPDKRIHWICGGLPKSDNLDECAAAFGNVAAAYTIGDAGALFARLLEPVMPVQRCEMLFEAVNRAHAAAKPGDVILFSPACASFDQFRDYEVRGDTFRAIVESMTGGVENAPGFVGRSPA